MTKIRLFHKEHPLLFCFIICFIIGLTAHAFAYTTLFPTHDALYNQYFDTLEYLHQTSLGRFLLPVYIELTGSVATLPFSVGIVSLLYLSCLSFIIADRFKLGTIASIAVSGIIVTNRTVIALTGTYMPWLGADCFAALLSGFAFYSWSKTRKMKLSSSMKHLIIAVICLVAALALYQAMISVFLVLVICQCIQDLLSGESSKTILTTSLRAACIVLVSGIVYFITFKAILFFGNIQIPNAYNSLSNLTSNSESLSSRIHSCYVQVFSLFFGSNIANIYPTIVIRTLNILATFLSIAFIFSKIIFLKLKKSSILLVIVLLLLLPLLSNICRILNSETHDLMYFGVWLLPLVPFLVRKEPEQHSLKRNIFLAISICCFVLIFANIQTANLAYQTKYSEYQATTLLMSEITSEIEKTNNYKEGETPVVFVGSIRNVIIDHPEQARLSKITGLPYEQFSTTGTMQPYLTPGSIDRYYQNILMRKTLVRPSTNLDIELAKSHSSYPGKDSIWVENDTVYVKL